MNKKQKISFYSILIIVVVAGISFLCFHDTNKREASTMEQALSLYQKGKFKKAKRYFEKADEEGIAEASFALGTQYFSGKGTNIDVNKALVYYHKAAQANYTPAKTTLALLYMNGDSVKQDVNTALTLAQEAAENGDIDAQLLLAKWFEDGQHIKKDIKQAVHFYEMAAKKGNKNAKIALSVIYKSGKGAIHENIFTSKRWEASLQKQKEFENIFQNLPADYIEPSNK